MVWLILVSNVTLLAKTNIAKGELTVVESQSVLAFGYFQNIDDVYIKTSDLNDTSAESLIFNRFLSSADLTQYQNPAKEYFLHQRPCYRENQKRANLRFFAYLTN